MYILSRLPPIQHLLSHTATRIPYSTRSLKLPRTPVHIMLYAVVAEDDNDDDDDNVDDDDEDNDDDNSKAKEEDRW